MPRQRRIDPFYIVVIDSEAGSFNVLGPMVDDTSITHHVVALQKQGRRVNCHTAGLVRSREDVIDWFTQFYRLAYTDERIAG